jgi:hypothetical protein
MEAGQGPNWVCSAKGNNNNVQKSILYMYLFICFLSSLIFNYKSTQMKQSTYRQHTKKEKTKAIHNYVDYDDNYSSQFSIYILIQQPKDQI